MQTNELAISTLLALGTLTAGGMCFVAGLFLGLIMALGIPAIAWIENSALLVALIAVASRRARGLVVASAPGTQKGDPYPRSGPKKKA